MKSTSSWLFIIHTDSYAGAFEREICAHITGLVGDCEVGEELFRAEASIETLLERIKNLESDIYHLST